MCFNLKEVGFNVRAIITDNHACNVSAFRMLLKKYEGDNKLSVYHSAYDGLMKTYLFYDMIHLVKNIRNNLINRKEIVFPYLEFNLFRDVIKVPEGNLSWNMLYKIYEKYEHLPGNPRKAPKLTYKAILPGNNKQMFP